MFLPVTTANGVTLDFLTIDADIPMQHYAFLVSDEFDEALARLVAARIPIQADPPHHHRRKINRNDGGRGVYFLDPAGHGLEILTRPYGTDPSSPLNGVTEDVPGAV
ncbi:Catechol 2,3-dioxygenase-like lactoylglutathione lyase family enzyme OS=Streptomyces violarus OX=67380 GN=FHS41_000669 PE=4 SV=1 [Streptomyces violarus]